MAIKITDKILSIPPYISTSWSEVAALHMKGGGLAVTLVGGETLVTPHLSTDLIQLAFQCHATFLEQELTEPDSETAMPHYSAGQDESPIRFVFNPSLEGIGHMMQHNPRQSESPDLPPEILDKIGAIAKIVGSGEGVPLPQPELGCNCFHCQIARALAADSPRVTSAEESDVSSGDLEFQQWTITQTGDKLFSVVNRLDEHEKYNVYLGHPVGCTCGRQGCEHILAVLKS